MNILTACLCRLLLNQSDQTHQSTDGRDIAPYTPAADTSQSDLGLVLLQGLFGLSSDSSTSVSSQDASVSGTDNFFEQLLLALANRMTEPTVATEYPAVAELITRPITTTTTTRPPATTTLNRGTVDLDKTGTIDANFFENPPAKVRYKGYTYLLKDPKKKFSDGKTGPYYQADRKVKNGFNHLTVRNTGDGKATVSTSDSNGSLPGYGSSSTVSYSVNTYSPLVFDLNANGKVTAAGKQQFDIDNDGKLDTINKIAAGDGLLVMDNDKDGIAGENASELFGNFTANQKFANGFDALKAIAKKELGDAAVADGKLDAAEIKALEDKIKLGLKVDGAVKSLTALGVSSINLNYNHKKLTDNKDGFGNVLGETSAFTQNGQHKSIIDVWFKKH